MEIIVGEIVLGIWGCILIIGSIAIIIEKMKVEANPLRKLFNGKKED